MVLLSIMVKAKRTLRSDKGLRQQAFFVNFGVSRAKLHRRSPRTSEEYKVDPKTSYNFEDDPKIAEDC